MLRMAPTWRGTCSSALASSRTREILHYAEKKEIPYYVFVLEGGVNDSFGEAFAYQSTS